MNTELNKVFYSFLSNWSPVEGVILSEMMSDLNDLISEERREARNEGIKEAARCASREIDNDECWRIPESIERLIK